MSRIVLPELLDTLPPTDPRALRSRADLRRLNWLMRHVDIICFEATILQTQPPRRIVELGAGDGTQMLAIARKLRKRWPGVHVTLVDRQNTVPAEILDGFQEFGWSAEAITADAFEWLESSEGCDLLVANLFLHHFDDEQLTEMLRLIAARTTSFVACESRRTLPSLFISRLLWLFGCNAVTRHDGRLSIQAGFAGQEFSMLWPEKDHWKLRERGAILFTHVFSAQRIR